MCWFTYILGIITGIVISVVIFKLAIRFKAADNGYDPYYDNDDYQLYRNERTRRRR